MKHIIIVVFLMIIVFYGCSASTGSRYETKEEKEESVNEKTESVELNETEIDITPYRETFDISEPPEEPIGPEKLDLWFTYNEDSLSGSAEREIVEQVDGYRVQVFVTDDLEEANQIRSEIYFKTNQKAVYIVFEPPFYKVKTGDFTKINEARDLNFKLSQMGYKESKVVSEKVNVYK